MKLDAISLAQMALLLALVLVLIGSLAFHRGHELGYRDGMRDARRTTPSGGGRYRTLGAMWDWRAETRPQERVRNWSDDDDG